MGKLLYERDPIVALDGAPNRQEKSLAALGGQVYLLVVQEGQVYLLVVLLRRDKTVGAVLVEIRFGKSCCSLRTSPLPSSLDQ